MSMLDALATEPGLCLQVDRTPRCKDPVAGLLCEVLYQAIAQSVSPAVDLRDEARAWFRNPTELPPGTVVEYTNEKGKRQTTRIRWMYRPLMFALQTLGVEVPAPDNLLRELERIWARPRGSWRSDGIWKRPEMTA